MDQTKIIRARAFDKARLRSIQSDTAEERMFAIQASVVITLIILAAWFLTG